MKKEIHPEYKKSTVKCSCGNTFETRSVMEEINVEICSECHPFFTGTQKLVDTAGRVDKFREKIKKAQELKKQKAEKEKVNKTEPNKTKETLMSAKGGSGVPTTNDGKGK